MKFEKEGTACMFIKSVLISKTVESGKQANSPKIQTLFDFLKTNRDLIIKLALMGLLKKQEIDYCLC